MFIVSGSNVPGIDTIILTWFKNTMFLDVASKRIGKKTFRAHKNKLYIDSKKLSINPYFAAPMNIYTHYE